MRRREAIPDSSTHFGIFNVQWGGMLMGPIAVTQAVARAIMRNTGGDRIADLRMKCVCCRIPERAEAALDAVISAGKDLGSPPRRVARMIGEAKAMRARLKQAQ